MLVACMNPSLSFTMQYASYVTAGFCLWSNLQAVLIPLAFQIINRAELAGAAGCPTNCDLERERERERDIAGRWHLTPAMILICLMCKARGSHTFPLQPTFPSYLWAFSTATPFFCIELSTSKNVLYSNLLLISSVVCCAFFKSLWSTLKSASQITDKTFQNTLLTYKLLIQ